MDRRWAKICLARQMLLYRRERCTHPRTAQCVSAVTTRTLRWHRSLISPRRHLMNHCLRPPKHLQVQAPRTRPAQVPGAGRNLFRRMRNRRPRCPISLLSVSPPPPQQMVQQQVLGGPATAVDQSSPHPDAAAPRRAGRSRERFGRCGWPANARCSSVTSLAIESKLVPSVVAKSDSGPSIHAQKENDSPQAASVLPLVPHVLQTAANLSEHLSEWSPKHGFEYAPEPPEHKRECLC